MSSIEADIRVLSKGLVIAAGEGLVERYKALSPYLITILALYFVNGARPS